MDPSVYGRACLFVPACAVWRSCRGKLVIRGICGNENVADAPIAFPATRLKGPAVPEALLVFCLGRTSGSRKFQFVYLFIFASVRSAGSVQICSGERSSHSSLCRRSRGDLVWECVLQGCGNEKKSREKFFKDAAIC